MIVLAAAVILCVWRKKRSDKPGKDIDLDGAGGNFARVSQKRQSRQELNQMREEAADEVAPPKYDNLGANPFSAAAFGRSQSPQLSNTAPAVASCKCRSASAL